MYVKNPNIIIPFVLSFFEQYYNEVNEFKERFLFIATDDA
ncbi:24543_t:CDS:2 [Gigaspora margarita]|uniref:24543_t:CDS:1 n=1 Tax=Gigaspora margarita TaxID=4874 RepID=A0ABM8VW53_GIGMA|nr:24543_t:CDS:2 [Gigaspora margarita]